MTYEDDQKFSEYVEKLSAGDYDWFVTLTVPLAFCEEDTDGAFDDWISQIEKEDQAYDWARVADKGR
jgi:hypothetical protein